MHLNSLGEPRWWCHHLGISLEAADRFIDIWHLSIYSDTDPQVLRPWECPAIKTAPEIDGFCVLHQYYMKTLLKWTCFGPKCAHQPKSKSKTPSKDTGWSWWKCVSLYGETSFVPTWAERPLSQEEPLSPKENIKKTNYSLQMHTGSKSFFMETCPVVWWP